MPLAQMPLLPETELSEWAHSLCFTGHRPEKLPIGDELTALVQTLGHYITLAAEIGFTHFYTGLADGIDYYAAVQTAKLREKGCPIRLIGVQPCEDYPAFCRYAGYDLRHINEMLYLADELIVLPGSRFTKGIFLKRNRFMVERSTGIIAVCSDGRSGSMQAYSYAKRLGLAYCRIFPHSDGPPFPAPQDWHVERCGI